MAVLEKIRVKFGLAISIIIALALLSFIVDPSTLETAFASMSSKYNVGRIGGKNISYTEFQEDVEKYTAINEIVTGSSVQNEEIQEQIRNSAWQELLDDNMFLKNARKAGITLGDEEVVALTTGEYVSPIIRQNPIFQGEDGQFSPEAVREFARTIGDDETGRMKIFWDYVQRTIQVQQYYSKYGSLFNASNYPNALVVANAVDAGNKTADLEYVFEPASFALDSTIDVPVSEIKKYYKDHKETFKRKASRSAEYVVYEVVPSQEDIIAVSDDFDAAYAEFAKTDNVKAFLIKNSDRQLSEAWYKAGELRTVSAQLDEFVFGKNAGVSPIIREDNTFMAARVIATGLMPDSVYVRHILVGDVTTKDRADSLVDVIKRGGSFSALVALHSQDQSSAADGELGNVGWLTQNYMIPGFESVMTAEVGKPFALKTRYGMHVVMVTKKTKAVEKKQVAIFEKTVLASKETFNDFYNKANTFATLAGGTLEGYRKAVDSLGVYSHKMATVLESTSSYGSVDQAKEVTRWIFDAKKGKASNIITVNNNFFFIVAVDEVRKDGYAPISEVGEAIRYRLYAGKHNEKEAARVREAIAGCSTIEAVAEALGQTVTKNADFALGMTSAYVDPVLAGAVLGAKEGVIAGPVASDAGVYVVKVNGVETGSFYTEEDAKAYELQKSQYTSQQILPAMMEAAGVEDNRARFY
ncbi:MAG: SurA N-terminal domain-containing protein [Bacteroidales bacterium]|nr:SurA N-terminal domain-containing protein [Bacteroidales bacterium]